MSTVLTLVAKIETTPDQVERVKAELLKLVEPTRKEAGCLQYELHQDNQNPALFMFYEAWQSRALWQAHMNSAHIAAFAQATEGAVASSTLHEMTKL